MKELYRTLNATLRREHLRPAMHQILLVMELVTELYVASMLLESIMLCEFKKPA